MLTLRKIWPRLAPFRGRFFLAALAMTVTAAASGAGVWILKPIVDQVFVSRDPMVLRWAVVAVPLVFLVKTAAAYAQNYLMSHIGQRVTQDLRRDLFAHLHTLSMDYFWGRRSGELLSRATYDLGQLESALHFAPLYLVRDSLTVAVLLGVLFGLHWKFAAVALLGLPGVGVILWVLGRKMRQASIEGQALMAGLYQRLQESLQGMLVIKAFHFERGALERFDRENERFYGQMMRYLRATALSGPLMELLGALVLTALLAYAGGHIIAGKLSPGAFLAFLACFMAAYAPTKNLARTNAEIQRGLSAAGRIFEVLAERPKLQESGGTLPCRGIRKGLELRGVGFRYPDREAWALRGVSLELRSGEKAAFVGPSGSGKSTLAYLLLRLFEPGEGRILLDGEPLSAYDTGSLRQALGFVGQDPFLFHDTVAFNLALGRAGAGTREIERACRLAEADGFIRSLPEGYDTQLGERGLKLSGGQRQRLAIARALVQDPPILLLDEATSNLDAATEERVLAGLQGGREGRTLILIAHRLSTIQDADRIFVLTQGSLAETGTHEGLMAAGGLYANLVRLQAQGLEPAAPSKEDF